MSADLEKSMPTDMDHDDRPKSDGNYSDDDEKAARLQVQHSGNGAGVGRYWPKLILLLILGGLFVAYNGLAWEPKFLVAEKPPVPRYVFTFGDSYTTTGFNSSDSNYPSLWNPLGNPGFPGNTTSGGANWVGMMIRDLAPAATMLYNFARYGATVNDELVSPLTSDGHDLRHQTNRFKDAMLPKTHFAPWTGQNSVFVFWMGINDVTVNNAISSIGLGNTETIKPNNIIDSYMKSIDSMQVVGARKFLVLTVPPIHRNPNFSKGDPTTVEKIKKDVRLFNEKLRKRAELWTKRHPGSTFRLVETQPIFQNILDQPQRNEAANAECQDPKGRKCLWVDESHPGQAVHKAVANKVYKVLDDISFWGETKK